MNKLTLKQKIRVVDFIRANAQSWDGAKTYTEAAEETATQVGFEVPRSSFREAVKAAGVDWIKPRAPRGSVGNTGRYISRPEGRILAAAILHLRRELGVREGLMDEELQAIVSSKTAEGVE